jgi:hypothetical protein
MWNAAQAAYRKNLQWMEKIADEEGLSVGFINPLEKSLLFTTIHF